MNEEKDNRQPESIAPVRSTDLLGDFTMEQKRNFVMRHTLQLRAWQQPQMQSEYRRYVEGAPDEWINKSFMQFAEMYEYDKNAITPRCASGGMAVLTGATKMCSEHA
jgi:hypothetical protein